MEDLKVKPKKVDRFKYLKDTFNFIQAARSRERERRKHYILLEWEERIKEYDLKTKQEVLDQMQLQRKEVLLELYRSDQRRIKNSKKKVERSTQIEQFTTNLQRRDKEAKIMDFYSENLTNWAIAGYHRDDREAEEAAQRAAQQHLMDVKAAKKAYQKQLIAEDAAILAEDRWITGEVESLMLKCGTVQYEPDLERTDDENMESIFQRNKALKEKREKKEKEEDAKITVGDDAISLKLTMKKGLDLVVLCKRLKKNAHRRTKDHTIPVPFHQDLSGTGQILTLKAEGLGEAGALSLAAELSRGACPMLETLNLTQCQVRSEGMGKIFQGIKAGNLLSLRALILRGNQVRRRGIEFMREICPSGVFMNLQLLDLRENELRDDGSGAVVNIILEGHFLNIVHINLQHNSITDIGFKKFVMVMNSLQDTKCPNLQRLNLENNLVTAEARRRNSPYPPCFSF
ncbi:hypothetical protein B484DRAFT_481147 [Ochromonadaceae sp. CCMP2298]|nr:hypothetical protein B484DRAFT_481147 [Ochromonadaceae sp. CCMP2298]